MSNHRKMYRQGDVLLVAVDSIPRDVTELPRTERGLVLAEGEATGHAHRIPSRSAKLYRTETDQRYMRATAGVQLGHEEHKTRCSVCPELPLVVATHYDVTRSAEEPERYTCDSHAGVLAKRLEDPGKTYLDPGEYHRTIDADYVPGEVPRPVAD